MKNLIGRAAVWFKDGEYGRLSLTKTYYPLSALYTRLLREVYRGKQLKFINIHFNSEKTYELYPRAPRHHLDFYNGHLNYNDVFDFDHFDSMSDSQKKVYIWSRLHEIVAAAAKKLANAELEQANEYAYTTVMQRSSIADYKTLETEVVLFDQVVTAAIWYIFKDDGMYSCLVLVRDNKELFRKELARGALGNESFLGNEFLLVMYKRITAKKDKIIIEYVRMAETPPVRIPIERAILEPIY